LSGFGVRVSVLPERPAPDNEPMKTLSAKALSTHPQAVHVARALYPALGSLCSFVLGSLHGIHV
jgi:hypothetical protein